MIILKELRWSYCFRYGANNVLHLNKNIITQLLGINGIGKSSIPLILEEVLFNKNSKGIKKASIANRYYNKGYTISLTFSIDTDEYEINVSRKTILKVSLSKNGQDVSSHTATGTYKTIQDLFGMDFKTFSQIVYQNTNTSLQFLTATDTNRKKFLIDLLHLTEYVKLFEVFKDAAKELHTEVVKYESKIATIEKWLSDNKLKDTTILPMLKIEIDTEAEEKELRQLTVEIQNISENNKKITKNNQYRKLLKSIDISEVNSSKSIQKISYDELQSNLGGLSSTITTANTQIRRLKSLGDVCPTCEQDIPESFKTDLIRVEELRISEAQDKCTELEQKIAEIKKHNAEVIRQSKLQKDWEDLYRSVDMDLPTDMLDLEQLESRATTLQNALRSAKNELAVAARTNEERTRRNTRIQVILEQTAEFEKELAETSIELAKVEHTANNLEILKKAFSTNGLPAYKIENKVKDLEALVNSCLAELSDGQFTLEFVLSNDKLNVMITDEGDPVDIVELSSGQLARVNTATLLAIRKLMSSISKSRINILFLDEVISVLDKDGKERLVEILLKEEDLNIYAVSHGWEHPLLEKIVVVDQGKYSELEY